MSHFPLVACPFPVVQNSGVDGMPTCFVVQGAFSIFGEKGQKHIDDLAWAELAALEKLEQDMDSGSLDNVDPAVSAIRFIPRNALLNVTRAEGPTRNRVGANNGEKNSRNVSPAPSWSWVVAGAGFFGVLAALLFIFMHRHRRRVLNADMDNETATPRKSRSGAFPGAPLEILDDNSECGENEIYQDMEETSQTEKSPQHPVNATIASWRQVPETQQSLNAVEDYRFINPTDPNQLVVQPVLDDESGTFMSAV